MMDEIEMFVNPLSFTFAAVDSMGEEGGCGIFYTHASGPGKFMVKVDALQHHTGDIRVVTQAEFADLCRTNGAVSENDGLTLLRSNTLPSTADYRLRASSPCRAAGVVSPLSGLTNQCDLVGTPMTGQSGELLRESVSVGSYQYVESQVHIPADWMQHYGLPTDGSADWLDSDGDNFDNYQEWIADTNPTNSSSAFRIESITPGPPVVLSLETSASRLYSLYSSTNLTTVSPNLGWTSVPGQLDIPGTGGLLTLSDPGTDTARFYRVAVRLP